MAEISDDEPRSGLPTPTAPSGESIDGVRVDTDTWHISVRFGVDVLRKGMDPLAILRYLQNLGEIGYIATLCDAPEVDAMDPESCYLGFEIDFRSQASKAAIEHVFDFVRDDCKLFILPPHSKREDFLRLIKELPHESMRLGEILVKCGALTQEELNAGLRQQTEQKIAAATPPSKLGQILVEQHIVAPDLVEAAAAKQIDIAEKKVGESRMIRVDADKLDRLIDLVGELVIAGASANLIALKSGQSALVEATSVLSRLVENVRDSTLQLRMVQIGETFNRFHRVVRDVAKECGKEIELFISGAETELDKTVGEKIDEPLLYLVRNAIEHGVEAVDVRLAHGKPAKGRLEMSAYHDSGNIAIEVADDGGGLDKAKIEAKALAMELIPAGHSLSEQEVFNLIFETGFSTADTVGSDVARSDGMDVARKNIQALRGSLEVASEAGVGTRFTIRLPLTLAIIDGFLVGVGKSQYVIPLDMVIECIELANSGADQEYLNLRGEVLPFIRLRDLFEIGGERPPRENIVVVRFAGQKAGIVVDQLNGEFQTVIKPLGAVLRNVRGIAGSTILGSGEVALIVDVASLVNRYAKVEEAKTH